MKVKQVSVLVQVVADDSETPERLKQLCDSAEELEKEDQFFTMATSSIFAFTDPSLEGEFEFKVVFNVTTQKLMRSIPS